MPEPIYVVVQFALLLVKVISGCMLVRFLLSWFELNPENVLVKLLYAMTEPAVQPIRKLFNKMNWFENIPIDVSLMVTCLLISLAEMIMEMLLL